MSVNQNDITEITEIIAHYPHRMQDLPGNLRLLDRLVRDIRQSLAPVCIHGQENGSMDVQHATSDACRGSDLKHSTKMWKNVIES
jgi:hypothetical protein